MRRFQGDDEVIPSNSPPSLFGVDKAMSKIDVLAERIRNPQRKTGRTAAQAVVIGSSTGGPDALLTLLSSIHKPLSVPIFIVQHMPAKFTSELARRLEAKVASTVTEAEHGTQVQSGICYIAPGGRHLGLRRTAPDRVTIAISDGPAINSCRPSVETLYESAAAVYGDAMIAVMLTGMGRDGSKSAVRVAELGCPILAQDRETSVVWGMPGAIVEAGLASDVLPLERIGPRIESLVRSGWPPIRETHRAHASRSNAS